MHRVLQSKSSRGEHLMMGSGQEGVATRVLCGFSRASLFLRPKLGLFGC